MAKDKGSDYDVGYGKPPVEHQFKKGKSGNPKGRPRYRMNRPQDAMYEALTEFVDVRVGGEMRRMTALEALQYRVVREALAGNPKMIERVMNNLPPALQDVRHEEIVEYTLSIDPPKPQSGSAPIPFGNEVDD